ncbi:ABC-type transport auxiliary lipoprotein family protein [Desulfovibrio sp. Fe33]|uniref:ABC-type transport auxiliary lipoprotein family protein n=1 Tax=Desulfovibrio sp. Fe33 TaxID=3020842 RepID=UPI00234C7B70|nr:ABC-type transport auxiliary lipoprotein family protein [Desulfovibrio sp. Fe33]
MKRYAILTAMLIAALAASACVKLGAQPLDRRFYQISPARTAPRVDAPKDFVLLVRRLSASDLYNTRELVYRGAEGHIESDFYNKFFVPPSNMLTTELRRWLSASGLFRHVIEPGSMIVPGLTLEGTINALYGDYSTAQPAAVVEMQFFAVDESTQDNAIVFSGSYKERIPMSSPTPDALVQAMTLAVRNIFANLETDMAAAPLKN